MAWPDDTDLPISIQAAFGADLDADPGAWAWTELAGRLRAEQIRIRVGKSSGARAVSPGTCTVTLDNDDSALTPLHPMSPWWPHVELGTPLRVRVQWAGVWYERFSGHADQWEPTYLPTGVVGQMSSAVRITCSGILRRLDQGTQPEMSAMRRATLASDPGAYWPAEDGGDATQAASAIPGHPPIGTVGPVDFAELSIETAGGNAAIGSLPLPDLSAGGRLVADVPAEVTAACATAGQYAIGVMTEVESGSTPTDLTLLEWATPGGTYVRWRFVFLAGAGLTWNLLAYNAAGAETYINGGAGQPFGHWRITAQQTGSSITLKLYLGSNFGAASVLAGTLAGPTRVMANATGATATAPVPMGHLTVWPTATPDLPMLGDTIDPYGQMILAPDVLPWEREAAHLRLARLCAEDGIPLTMPTVPADAITRMGPQPAGTWADLAQECVDADGGILVESGYGLTYTPRHDRYNPPTALTIDLTTYRVSGTARDVLTAAYDDQQLRNRWTISRVGGSSAVADDVDSQRRGVYSDSLDLSLASDAGLADRAAWQVHLHKDIDLAEATFPIDLAANPGLIDGWLACGVGSRIVRTGAPAQHRPGPMDRLVEGWTETISPRAWLVQVAPAPTGPWLVAEVDGEQRAAADGSTLAADITATATTILLASTAAGGVWTTDPADMPLDVRVGGEQVRLSAITGTSSPQTATVAARSVNGITRAWPSGAPVDVWAPAISPL